ncbi:MAG: LytTR family DNA-binding domain-containing protein [Frankiaceae bacterium]|jgi:DNA-binding LytR/AlgR family response regulator|nr:LytTR family DNA-binding domain-containing protein [Frankiaceae bacterium]
MRALVVDDEQPARGELEYLLRRDSRIAAVRCAGSAEEALRMLGEGPVDVVFSDIKMPGLSGMELARVLARFAQPPRLVFVTAYEEHAVHAFELRAADYLLKPVRADRLAEAVRRVAAVEPAGGDHDETIPIELGGVTRFVRRSDVRYVEASGDYARLHTETGSHLVRMALSTLNDRWADAGFVRIHRSTLVALAHIDELRVSGGRCAVRLGGRELLVSRRHTRELRDLLIRRGAGQ